MEDGVASKKLIIGEIVEAAPLSQSPVSLSLEQVRHPPMQICQAAPAIFNNHCRLTLCERVDGSVNGFNTGAIFCWRRSSVVHHCLEKIFNVNVELRRGCWDAIVAGVEVDVPSLLVAATMFLLENLTMQRSWKTIYMNTCKKRLICTLKTAIGAEFPRYTANAGGFE